jgi:FkbM family methyltransferase
MLAKLINIIKLLLKKVTPRFFIYYFWLLPSNLLVTCINLSVCLFDSFKPFVRSIQYKKFTLYYSKGTTLVEKRGFPTIRLGGTYEPAESKAISNELKRYRNPVFVDIGANIGLMTLNVLAVDPNTRIFAFEPSRHPYSLLERTIEANKLQNNVTLHKIALSYREGMSSFAFHISADSSGDGFLDTGRAGEVEYQTVEMQTLDQWWSASGYPQVNVIKIDTEGAELWILQGGVEFFTQCRPIIFLEINPLNLISYPYTEIDILQWLNSNAYQLETLTQIYINIDNLINITKVNNSDMFIARPLL